MTPKNDLSSAERLLILSALPPEMLGQFFQSKASAPDAADWMQALVDSGLLDLEAKIRDATSPNDYLARAEEWEARVTDFFYFLPFARSQKSQQDPLYGDLAHEGDVLQMPRDPAVEAIFVQQTHALVAQIASLRTHPLFQPEERYDPVRGKNTTPETQQFGIEPPMGQLTPPLSHWLCLACLLDLPQEVALLAETCPEAMRCATQTGLLGSAFFKTIDFDVEGQKLNAAKKGTAMREAKVGAFLCALNASSAACMDALLAAGVGHNPRLLITNINIQEKSFRLSETFDAVHPLCHPSAFEHALRHFMTHEHDANTIGAARVHMLDALAVSHHQSKPMVIGMARAGLFDSAPFIAIGQAVEQGHRSVIDHFDALHQAGAIALPLEKIFTSFPAWAAQSAEIVTNEPDPIDHARREDTVLAMLALAQSAGYEAQAFALSAKPSDRDLLFPYKDAPLQILEPIASFTDAGFSRVLVAYIEQGMDPEHAPDSKTFSPLQYAQMRGEAGEQGAFVMRTTLTHMAAKRAMAEMDGIGLASAPVRP